MIISYAKSIFYPDEAVALGAVTQANIMVGGEGAVKYLRKTYPTLTWQEGLLLND